MVIRSRGTLFFGQLAEQAALNGPQQTMGIVVFLAESCTSAEGPSALWAIDPFHPQRTQIAEEIPMNAFCSQDR